MRKAYPNEIFHSGKQINSGYEAKRVNDERLRRRRARGGSGEAYDYYKQVTNRVIKPGQKPYFGYDITIEDIERLAEEYLRGGRSVEEIVADYWKRNGKNRYNHEDLKNVARRVEAEADSVIARRKSEYQKQVVFGDSYKPHTKKRKYY